MRTLITVLALLTMVSGAAAQSAVAPTYTVGDTWTLKAGSGSREITVLAVADGSVEMRGYLASCATCVVQLDRSLGITGVLDGGGKPADPTQIGFVPMGNGWQLFSFPLETKKAWNFSASAFLRSKYEDFQFSNRIEALEDVKTSAGTFKAYRIVRDVVLKGGQAMGGRGRDATWRTTSWFAPDVKFVVKTVSTSVGATDTELLSYQVK